MNKKEERDISLSEWLQFLENRANTNIQIIIGMTALIGASFVGLALLYFEILKHSPTYFVVAIGLFILFCIPLVYYLYKRHILGAPLKEFNCARKLANEIIEEEISDIEEIKKRWLKETGKKYRNIMFDTNAFDRLLEGAIPLELIQKSLSLGYRYFITHIQTDEVSDIPDEKKEKRHKMVLFLSAVAPSLIPTESTALDVSRWGFAKLGDAKLYKELLNESKNNVKDALIGETAIKNNFILVTENNEFKSKVEKLGGTALKVNEFNEKLTKELEEQ